MINKILAKWHKFNISVRTLKREVVYVTIGNPDWRTFSRRVTAPWWRQWAKSQVLTNQNSKNRWCQIVRWTNWQRLQVYGFNEIMRREVQRSSSRLDYRGSDSVLFRKWDFVLFWKWDSVLFQNWDSVLFRNWDSVLFRNWDFVSFRNWDLVLFLKFSFVLIWNSDSVFFRDRDCVLFQKFF